MSIQLRPVAFSVPPTAPPPVPGASTELLLQQVAELQRMHGDTSDPDTVLKASTEENA